ncbi:uncharacterized protein PHACADRAFT_210609, partial [Phanerochaete carnosa HHB-10118-sp]
MKAQRPSAALRGVWRTRRNVLLLDNLVGELSLSTSPPPSPLVADGRMSPLAKCHQLRPGLCEHFEGFMCQMEVRNACVELNDLFEQRLRFEERLRWKEQGDDEKRGSLATFLADSASIHKEIPVIKPVDTAAGTADHVDPLRKSEQPARMLDISAHSSVNGRKRRNSAHTEDASFFSRTSGGQEVAGHRFPTLPKLQRLGVVNDEATLVAPRALAGPRGPDDVPARERLELAGFTWSKRHTVRRRRQARLRSLVSPLIQALELRERHSRDVKMLLLNVAYNALVDFLAYRNGREGEESKEQQYGQHIGPEVPWARPGPDDTEG